MARLQFYFSEFDEEIDAISKVADKFIHFSSAAVFMNLRRTLGGVRQAPAGRAIRWGIAEELPLYTNTSAGEYEPDSEGEHLVYAEITSVWELVPLGPHNPGAQPHRKFELSGLASTKVRLREGSVEEPGMELAMWRMEIGDEQSPGCHFHVQILGESADGPFPHSLPVPRLPGLLMTPMAVVEFVLAELFQDSWKSHATKSTANMQRWQSIQQNRITSVLEWQNEIVRRSTGAPWTALKWAKPLGALCLGE
jgi:hypothetical protein